MDILRVQQVGGFHPHINDHLTPFTYEFHFSRSYLLDAKRSKGGASLAWFIAGGDLKDGSLNDQIITLNGNRYSTKDRKRDSWIVRYSERNIKRLGLFQMTVRELIRHGLRTASNQYISSEAEIVKRFWLTPQRLERPMRQLSHEAWSASCAVGLAHGKRIFAFPFMDYIIEEHNPGWFKNDVDLLRDSGALVLVPAEADSTAVGLCDEIVYVNQNLY